MEVVEIPELGRFAIVRNGETLNCCPCCGSWFKTREAAEKVKMAIVDHQWSWRAAITLQETVFNG